MFASETYDFFIQYIRPLEMVAILKISAYSKIAQRVLTVNKGDCYFWWRLLISTNQKGSQSACYSSWRHCKVLAYISLVDIFNRWKVGFLLVSIPASRWVSRVYYKLLASLAKLFTGGSIIRKFTFFVRKLLIFLNFKHADK